MSDKRPNNQPQPVRRIRAVISKETARPASEMPKLPKRPDKPE
jgi:hypothetical protein